jgi:hypothetical protein
LRDSTGVQRFGWLLTEARFRFLARETTLMDIPTRSPRVAKPNEEQVRAQARLPVYGACEPWRTHTGPPRKGFMINDTRKRILIRRIARRLAFGEQPIKIHARALRTQIDAIGRQELLAQQRLMREAERYARVGRECARQLATCMGAANLDVCLQVLSEYMLGTDHEGPPDSLSAWINEKARSEAEDESGRRKRPSRQESPVVGPAAYEDDDDDDDDGGND